MRATAISLGLGLACLALVGLVGPAAAEDVDSSNPLIGDVPNGTRLYRTHCTVCHGFDGSGLGSARATLKKAPADHRNGSLMNARDDRLLIDTIKAGCAARGCSKAMPAFGAELSSLSTWDLVAYLRSLHVPLVNFFPTVGVYLVKQYHVGQVGNADFKDGQLSRLKKYAGKVAPAELKQTVFTLFAADRPLSTPKLVPQDPRQLARLEKDKKIGYVLFMELTGPRKRKVPVGLALDRNFRIVKLITTLADPGLSGEYNRRFEQYTGMGKRGDAPKFSTGRDKISKLFDKAVVRTYALAVESVNAFELEEKERSWADDTF
jgi:mono/diheme cytochrome c family protein